MPYVSCEMRFSGPDRAQFCTGYSLHVGLMRYVNGTAPGTYRPTPRRKQVDKGVVQVKYLASICGFLTRQYATYLMEGQQTNYNEHGYSH